MNGTFRLEERIAGFGLQLTGLDDAGTPAFNNRAGGDKQAQAPPPDWTEDQQASYYAHNYLNIVWGEKYGPDLSDRVLRKWGLKIALEVRLPPVGDDWLKDPANASAVQTRKTWAGDKSVVDPTAPAGRKAYQLAFADALRKHPQTGILYTLYGDYSYVLRATMRHWRSRGSSNRRSPAPMSSRWCGCGTWIRNAVTRRSWTR